MSPCSLNLFASSLLLPALLCSCLLVFVLVCALTTCACRAAGPDHLHVARHGLSRHTEGASAAPALLAERRPVRLSRPVERRESGREHTATDALLTLIRLCVQTSSHAGMQGAPCWVWNALAEQAYRDGAHYFYQAGGRRCRHLFLVRMHWPLFPCLSLSLFSLSLSSLSLTHSLTCASLLSLAHSSFF